MARSRRAVRCRQPSVPCQTVDVREDLRRQAQQVQELAPAGTGHPVPASEFRGVLDRAGVDQLPPRAGAGEGLDDAGPSGPRRTSPWPASVAAAAGDGTQQDSPVFAGASGWPAAPSGRGPLERGPSSECMSDGPCGFGERRGPPARGCTGRAG